MIERTTFDLRLAEHAATTAAINRGDWRHDHAPWPRALRAALAAGLVVLAVRLDGTATRAQRQDAPLAPANPA